jgi:hypothetical protein
MKICNWSSADVLGQWVTTGFGGLWVQSPELELRDLPGDTPNRLRKARAKELSES